eukprot:TRINITY_DN5530_c0_g1_i5.p2 TRINITY_DN5530_c0_g1~~TRINITY_DN5530_c0_g1_i5.p2  ORF type:complete len:123 (+),score=22.74 TRINITY_DN5530_c0_g1_i5:67-435(+)
MFLEDMAKITEIIIVVAMATEGNMDGNGKTTTIMMTNMDMGDTDMEDMEVVEAMVEDGAEAGEELVADMAVMATSTAEGGTTAGAGEAGTAVDTRADIEVDTAEDIRADMTANMADIDTYDC